MGKEYSVYCSNYTGKEVNGQTVMLLRFPQNTCGKRVASSFEIDLEGPL